MERKAEYAHGELAFFVIEGERVIQFKVMLGFGVGQSSIDSPTDWPMAIDLGYHSPEPMYEGHTPMAGDCRFTEGPCYYDGTSLGAAEPLEILKHRGEEALWRFLENYWRRTFEEREAGGFGQTVAAISAALMEDDNA